MSSNPTFQAAVKLLLEDYGGFPDRTRLTIEFPIGVDPLRGPYAYTVKFSELRTLDDIGQIVRDLLSLGSLRKSKKRPGGPGPCAGGAV